MTNMTLAAIGTTEWVLIVMAAGLLLMVPLTVVVVLWACLRGKQAPPAQGI
jgi:hypothetical protein